jgi:hypothetical protein
MTTRPPRRPPLFTPGAGAARRAVERRSARILLLAHQLPRWLVPAALAILLVAGLALPGLAGAVALAVLAVALGWFAYLSWPAVSSQGRLLRTAAIMVVLLLAVIHVSR